jgi:AcrR family transcriptional regulator
MPPDERRAAIIAATLPLVVEHGPSVSTRMIACAAGIAEGTIFRVFRDKETLLDAVVEAAFDNAPAEQALAEIPLDLPLEERLLRAVEIVQERVARIWRIASTVGVSRLPDERRRPQDLIGLAALFEPDRDRFSHDPETSARLLRSLTLAVSHPTLTPQPLAPAEVVSLLLDGIRSR